MGQWKNSWEKQAQPIMEGWKNILPKHTSTSVLHDIEQIIHQEIAKAKQEVVGEIEKDLLEWYAERQAERGVRAWTDDYLSSGDTLSGTILPIIKTYLAKLKD